MSFIRESDRAAILGLVTGKLSEDALLKHLGVTRSDVQERILKMLERVLAEQDGDALEYVLYLGHWFGLSNAHLPVLETLAVAPWHECHEDVVDALATLRSATSVGALYQAATSVFPYREYDDAYSLAVKCIWALGTLATHEAVARLGDLAHCGNSVIEFESRHQLRRVTDADGVESVRAVARDLLAKFPEGEDPSQA